MNRKRCKGEVMNVKDGTKRLYLNYGIAHGMWSREYQKFYDVSLSNCEYKIVCKTCEWICYDIRDAVRHYIYVHENEIDDKKKLLRRIPLKPWKDPESLFCDTKFLEGLIGKKIRTIDECREVKINK